MSKVRTKWIEDAAVTKEKVNSDVVGEGLKKVAIADPISLDIPGLAAAAQIDAINDDFVIYDADVAGHRRAKISDVLSSVLEFNQQVAITGTTTSTATTDTLISGLTITPGAGTYMVFLSGTLEASVKSRTMHLSIYVGGVQVAVTERDYSAGEPNQPMPFALPGILVSPGAGEAVEARWRTTVGNPANTMSFTNRHLSLVEVV